MLIMNPYLSQVLILHADDLGLNPAVNQGILRGFRYGPLTSTALLANGPAAGEALLQWKLLEEERSSGGLPSAAIRRELSDLPLPFDLGVHLNLTEGRPCSGNLYPDELLDYEGRFPGIFLLFAKLLRHGNIFQSAIRRELEMQIEMVYDYGLKPIHLNGHQYVEMLPNVKRLLPALMEKFGIAVIRVAHEPALFQTTIRAGFGCEKWLLGCVKQLFARRFRTMVYGQRYACPDVFFGTAHAGEVDLELMERFLAAARKYKQVEIGLHPAAATDTLPAETAVVWPDRLAQLRPLELEMLLDRRLTDLLQRSGRRLGRLAALAEG